MRDEGVIFGRGQYDVTTVQKIAPLHEISRMSPLWILLELKMLEVMVTTGATRRAKLQPNRHQQTNIQLFYRLDAFLVAQPTVSKH